jgi:hypothetical protein
MKTYQQKILRFDINKDYLNIPLILINEELMLDYEVGNHHTLSQVKWFKLVWKLHYTNPNNNDEVIGMLVSHLHEIIKSEIAVGILAEAVSFSISGLRQKVEDASTPSFLTLPQLNTVAINMLSKEISKALLLLPV